MKSFFNEPNFELIFIKNEDTIRTSPSTGEVNENQGEGGQGGNLNP